MRPEPTQVAVQPTYTPPPQQEGVIVRTDKGAYRQGETVVITVRNDLDLPIWYAQQIDCGLSFWLLQTCEGEPIVHEQPCIWSDLQHDFTRLEPGETLTGQWAETKIENRQESKLADPGCYRMIVPYVPSEEKVGPEWGEGKTEALAQFEIR
jgi:hypothetical protein